MADSTDNAQKAADNFQQQALHEARSSQLSAGAGTELCVHCGDAIAPQRRAALPHAKTCITCQEELERGY